MSLFKVKSPNEAYTGAIAGVMFVNGESNVDNQVDRAAFEYFTRQGFTLETVEADKGDDEAEQLKVAKAAEKKQTAAEKKAAKEAEDAAAAAAGANGAGGSVAGEGHPGPVNNTSKDAADPAAGTVPTPGNPDDSGISAADPAAASK